MIRKKFDEVMGKGSQGFMIVSETSYSPLDRSPLVKK